MAIPVRTLAGFVVCTGIYGAALGQINPPPIFNGGYANTYYANSPSLQDSLQAPGNSGWYTGGWYWDLNYFSGNYYWTRLPTLYYQDKLDSTSPVIPVKDLPLYDLPAGLGPYGYYIALPTYSGQLSSIGGLDRIRELPLECSPKVYPVSSSARYAINLTGGASGYGRSGALFYVTAFYDDTLFTVELFGQQLNGAGNGYNPGVAVLGPYVPRLVIGNAVTRFTYEPKRFTNITANPEYVKVALRPGRNPRDAGAQSVQLKVDTIRWTGDSTENWTNTGDAYQYVRNGGVSVQVFNLELPPDWCEDAPGLSAADALPVTTLSSQQRQAAEFDGMGAKLMNDITAQLPALKVGHNRFRAGRTLAESLGNDAYWHSSYAAGPFVRVNLLGVWCAVDDLPGWSFQTDSTYLIVKDGNEGLDYHYQNLAGGGLQMAPLKLRFVKRQTTTVRTYNYTGSVLNSQVAGDNSIAYAHTTEGADSVLTVTGSSSEGGTRTISMRFDAATGYARQAMWSNGGPARRYVYIVDPTRPAKDGRVDKVLDAAGEVLLDFEYDDLGRLTQTTRGSAGTYQILNEHAYTAQLTGGKITATEVATKAYVDATHYQPIWRKLDEYHRVVEVKMYAALQSGTFNPAAAFYLTKTIYRPQTSLGIANGFFTIEKRLPAEQAAEYSVFDNNFNVIRTFLDSPGLSSYSAATAKSEKRYTYELKGGIWQKATEVDVARSNATTTYSYDDLGFATGRSLPAISAANSASGTAIPGQVETQVYNPTNRKRIDSAARRDGQNALINITNTYDAYDNLDTRLEAGSGWSRQTVQNHNAFGQIHRTVDPDGFVTRKEFDSGSGLLRKQYVYQAGEGGPVLQEVQYEYDLSGQHQGRLRKVHTADHVGPFSQGSPAGWQETVFVYDAYGRVSSKTTTHTAKPGSYQWVYAYDCQDHVTQITYPDGMWVRTIRDGRGAVVNEYVGFGGDTVNGTGGTTVLTNTYGYHATTGNLEGRTNQTAADEPNQTTYGYDAYNRRTTRTDVDDGTATYNIVTTYEYNAGLDVVRQYVREDAGGPLREYIERSYDELGRVWKETVRSNPAAADASKDRITYTSYDVTGNERETRVRDVLAGDAVTTRTFTCFDYPDTMTRALTGSTSALTDYTTDLRGNVTVIVDPVNNQTEHDYDALSQRTESRFYEGSGAQKVLDLKTVTVYTSRQQRAKQTQYDAYGIAIDQQRWEYDALGNQSRWARMANPSSANPVSTSVDRVVDAASDGVGRRLTQTTYDAGVARTTTWTYNGLAGRLSDITHPLAGSSEGFSYHANTTRVLQHTVTDPINSRVTETYFDAFGRLRERVEKVPAGVTGVNEVKKRFTYDAANRRVREIQVVPELLPNSEVTTLNQYDGIGQLSQADEDYTGANQRTVSFTYTQKGDLLTETTNNGEGDQVTTFEHNCAGHRTSVRRPGAPTALVLTPDAAGRTQTRQAEDGFVTWYKRDWRGNVLEKRQTDAGGAVLESFWYDPLGRMTYACVGLPEMFDHTTIYWYGDGQTYPAFVDEPAWCMQKVGGWDVEWMSDYNTAGMRSGLQYPNEDIYLTYHRDNFDQVTAIDRDGVRLVNYTYAGRNVTSRQVRTTAAGQEKWVEVAWERPDQLRRPKTVTNRLRTGSTNGVGGTTADLVKFDNVFDSASNLDSQTVTGSPLRSGLLDPGYDRLMRLRRIDYPDATYESWDLDAFSNWTSYTPRSGPTLTFADNVRDQYTSVSGQAAAPAYDAKGNLTRDDRGYGYVYDYENRLIEVYTDSNRNGVWDAGEPVHAEYIYDALGHRVSTVTGGTQFFHVYDRDTLLADFGLSGPLAERLYINGTAAPDEKVLLRASDGREYYYLQDHLGSIVGLANEKGGRVASYAYDGYGEPTAAGPEGDFDADGDVDLRDFLEFQKHFGATGPAAAGYDLDGNGTVDLADYRRFEACLSGPGVDLVGLNPFGFTGQRCDRLDGGALVLYDYKARTYLPRLGRFLQTDSSGPADSYNLYEYCRSNPTTRHDPTGRFSLGSMAATFAIGAALNASMSFAFGERSPKKLVINALISGVASVATAGMANIIGNVVSNLFIETGLVAVSAGSVSFISSIASQYLNDEPVDTRKAKNAAIWAAATAGVFTAVAGVGEIGAGGTVAEGQAAKMWDIATGIASEFVGASADEIYQFLLKVEKKLYGGSSI